MSLDRFVTCFRAIQRWQLGRGVPAPPITHPAGRHGDAAETRPPRTGCIINFTTAPPRQVRRPIRIGPRSQRVVMYVSFDSVCN